MVATKAIVKMLNDYNNIGLTINSCVKYSFSYNGYKTNIFYTQENGLQDQFIVVMNVNSTDYLLPISFFKLSDGNYTISSYIPNELYSKVFPFIFKNGDNYSPVPYMSALIHAIETTLPVGSNYKKDLSSISIYKYKTKEAKPYFDTIIRKNMSTEMRKKIFSIYPKDLAYKLTALCGKTHTLRFTNDLTRAKDILVIFK